MYWNTNNISLTTNTCHYQNIKIIFNYLISSKTYLKSLCYFRFFIIIFIFWVIEYFKEKF